MNKLDEIDINMSRKYAIESEGHCDFLRKKRKQHEQQLL